MLLFHYSAISKVAVWNKRQTCFKLSHLSQSFFQPLKTWGSRREMDPQWGSGFMEPTCQKNWRSKSDWCFNWPSWLLCFSLFMSVLLFYWVKQIKCITHDKIMHWEEKSPPTVYRWTTKWGKSKCSFVENQNSFIHFYWSHCYFSVGCDYQTLKQALASQV